MNRSEITPGKEESGPLECTPGREKIFDQVINYSVGGLISLVGVAIVFSIVSKEGGDPGELVALLFALPFLGFGVYLLFFWTRVVLQPEEGLVRKIRSAGPLRYSEKQRHLSEALGVRVRKKITSSGSNSGQSKWIRYLVQLVFSDGTVIDLSTSSADLAISQRNAYRWARHCGLPVEPRPGVGEDLFIDPFENPDPFLNKLQHSRIEAPSYEIPQSYQERARIGSTPKIDRTADSLRIEIPGIGIRFYHVLNSLILAVALMVLASCFGCAFPPFFAVLPLLLPIFFFAAIRYYREEISGPQIIEITADSIRVEGPRRTTGQAFSDLMDVQLRTLNSEEGRKATSYGGGIVELTFMDRQIQIGHALSIEELLKLHGLLFEFLHRGAHQARKPETESVW